MTMIWHNGRWRDEADPVFSIHDRMRLGECVFGTILCIDGQLIRGQEHIDKLFRHLRVMGLSIPYTHEVLLETAGELLEKNNLCSGRSSINIMVTGGMSGSGIRPPEDQKPDVAMRAAGIPETFPDVHAWIIDSVRRNEGSPLSQIKCSNYGENIIALKEALQKGGSEAILLNNAGHIACATVASVFVVKDGTLYTPPLSDAAQDGVTRRALIEAHDVTEQSLTPEDLLNSEGIYLANSLRGVKPVLTLNGQDMPTPSLRIDENFHLK